MYDKGRKGDKMHQSRQRLTFMAYLILVVFVLLACRFFYLQTFKSQHLQEKVVEQRVKEIVDKPERGRVIDKNGEVMAFSLMAKDISLYPNLITTKEHQEKLAKLLSKELKMPYEKVMKKITAKDKNGNPLQWINVANRVDVDVAKRIQDSGLGGIEIKNAPKRYYPNENTGSSILGFVNDEGEPGAGVELKLDRYLRGVPGYRLAETDSVGKVIPIGFENISTALDGQTVQLTTDNYLQHVVETSIEKTKKELNASSVHAVMMNPKTGAILAMASTPSYDPNKYSKYDKRTWTLNPATYVYEPGSTFKPVYMAMAMDMGAINDDTHFYDGAGTINVNGSTIKNWDSRPLGDMGLRDIIINSSNVGMIHISRTMSSKETVDGLKKAGFGKPTGIELPGEEIGLFPTPKSLDDDPIRKATVSFGQGISITPVQLTQAFSEVINGGKKVNAHLVDKIEDKFGNTILDGDEHKDERVYKKSTSDNIKKYLNANMEEGSGKNMRVDGYKMGGKTGSAWLVENGRYVQGEIVGSFLGFAPYDDPEVALLVVVEKPKGAEFGSTSAGPAWKEIMEETLRYKSLNEANEKTKEIQIPDVRWMLADEAEKKIEKEVKDAKVKVEGKGEVVVDREYRYKNNKMEITLITEPVQDGKSYNIPNLIGKDEEEVNRLLKGTKLNIKYHGHGVVKEQSIQPGRYKGLDEPFVIWKS